MDVESKEAVRPAHEADRATLRELLGDDGALGAGRHAHVAARDPASGVAIWSEASRGQGELVLVVTNAQLLSENNGRRLFYELSLACAREALTRGVLRGRFVLRDLRVLKMIERDFDVVGMVTGRDRGLAVEWEVEVDVPDAVRQLERVLRKDAAG